LPAVKRNLIRSPIIYQFSDVELEFIGKEVNDNFGHVVGDARHGRGTGRNPRHREDPSCAVWESRCLVSSTRSSNG